MILAAIAAAAAAALAGPDPAAPCPPGTADRAEPRPPAALVWPSYPPTAPELSTPGEVVIHCQVSAEGLAHDCSLRREAPPNLGFGAAAMAMAREYRFQPATRCGRPVDSEADIPIRFAPRSGRAPDAGPPPSPRALALARQMVDELHAGQVVDARFETLADAIVRRRMATLTPAQQAALKAAVTDAVAARRAQILEAAADSYARAFTEAELERAVQLLATPAGQSLGAMTWRLDQSLDAALADAAVEVQWQALAGYCARTGGCPAGLTPGAGKE